MGLQQNRTSQQAIILFTRYPQAGKVKTRLIDRLGPQGAANLHDQLTKQVISNIEPILQTGQAKLQVSYCGATEQEMTDWLGLDISFTHQQGNDLGKRMQHAFEYIWQQGAEKVLLIGSDCPGIDSGIIRSGQNSLQTHDLVLGPAVDGGYYLIGLHAHVRGYELLFQRIAWGTEQVLQQSIEQAEQASLSYTLLPKLHDIDCPEDLVHLNHYTDSE
ncbi:TIGR04282 family arsenosugar biosynthesis glycosyltransferase [Desulfobulbus sp. TB]|nr:TIGR04282 family arsenosugar biosynthesis glycosyltransferase [Desulfobulbus sp. TB]